METRTRVGVAGFLTALVAMALPLPSASAHADYRDSTPADGAMVSSPPSSVRAEFTEAPADGSTLKIYDACGDRVDSGGYTYEGIPFNSITVSMSGDKAGEYAVEWTVVSEEDGHATRGTFTFTSSGGGSCPGASGGRGNGGGKNDSGGSGPNDGAGDVSGTATGGSTSEGSSSSSEGGEGRPDASGEGKDRTKAKNRAATDKADERDMILTGESDDAPPPAEEDIPMDWLIVGLSISALIGAVGGRVYAGIVGPR